MISFDNDSESDGGSGSNSNSCIDNNVAGANVHECSRANTIKTEKAIELTKQPTKNTHHTYIHKRRQFTCLLC